MYFNTLKLAKLNTHLKKR